MINKAYFLIETVIGKSREVSLGLQECDWVEYVERVVGPYDVVGIAQGHASCDIEELVKDGVRSIDGVIRVVVCPISTALEMGVPAIAATVS